MIFRAAFMYDIALFTLVYGIKNSTKFSFEILVSLGLRKDRNQNESLRHCLCVSSKNIASVFVSSKKTAVLKKN